MSEYNNLCFEVRNERGMLQATFCRKWEAEKYAEGRKNWTVTKNISKVIIGAVGRIIEEQLFNR